MDRERARALLWAVQRGELEPDDALDTLAQPPVAELPSGAARVDLHRALRQGLPEVIYGPGKQPYEIAEIARTLRAAEQSALATRIEPDVASQVLEHFPGGVYDGQARLLWYGPDEVPIQGQGTIAVVCAGTSDLPVAREAAGVAQRFGNKVELLADVGVAGLHRLLERSEVLRAARVVIAVAGMEAALASVVGGLVDKPVIAVPTSVGYGASFGGVAALLSMLNSCASNVTVVNIDNGFGAATVATLINRL